MLRNILISFTVLALLLLGAGGFFYFKLRSALRESNARTAVMGRELQVRVIKGKDDFEKHVFYVGESLGDIGELSHGWPAFQEGAEISVVGTLGADYIDLTGHTRKRVRFSPANQCPVRVARLDPSGEYGFLTHDESWSAPVTFFDRDGRAVWHTSDAWQGINDSVAGNFLGDGKLSVAVGFNGSGGVALLDGLGKTVWKKEETNVWHVEALDTNGDGREELIHSNGKGQLIVRDGNGQVIATYLPGSYVSNFALTRWGQETRPSHILVPTSESRQGCCNPVFLVLDAHGNKVETLESPHGDMFAQVRATPIHFKKKEEYFAVLENQPSRSMLLLYGETGQTLYQEILGEQCQALAAIPQENGERLMIGCGSKVLEYSPADSGIKSVGQNKPISH